jgi:hypothetical protein
MLNTLGSVPGDMPCLRLNKAAHHRNSPAWGPRPSNAECGRCSDRTMTAKLLRSTSGPGITKSMKASTRPWRDCALCAEKASEEVPRQKRCQDPNRCLSRRSFEFRSPHRATSGASPLGDVRIAAPRPGKCASKALMKPVASDDSGRSRILALALAPSPALALAPSPAFARAPAALPGRVP